MFDLPIKLFVDCVDIATIARQAEREHIAGFTTNPTLMRRAGILKYEPWAKSAIISAKGKPISFEVIADDLHEIDRQARLIASWGENIYVKIPITDTHGKSMLPVAIHLSKDGIKVNVTGVLTRDQAWNAVSVLEDSAPVIISVFAGRIADTGCDPVEAMTYAMCTRSVPGNIEFLWASTREVYNITQAVQCGCDIITVTPEILSKLSFLNKALVELSLETVQQFYSDAVAAGYSL